MKYFTFLLLTLQFMGAGLSAETINLEEARTLALRNSPDLARLNLTARMRALDEKSQNFQDNYPSLSLSAEAGTTLLNWDRGFSGDLIADNFTLGANVGVRQRLFNWDGRNSIRKAIENLNTESARQDALAEYFRVLNSVDSAYYSVLEAQAGLQAAELSLETSALSLSIAEIRQQNGMLNATDYLRTLAEKENREISRNQSRRDLSLAMLRFNNMLGIHENVELEPIDFESLESLMQILARIDDAGFERLLSVLRESIERRNPTLVKEGISLSRAEKNLDLTRREYLPDVSASLRTGIGLLGYNSGNGFTGLTPNNITFSLTASIPLDFWVRANNVEKQKIALEQSALSYRGTLESIDIDLQICLLNLVSQAGQTLSSSRALELSRMNFEQVFELYRLGQGSQAALSDAEYLLRNSTNQYDRSRYSFLQALSSLRSLGAFEEGAELAILLSELNLH